jgi:hypothetical protein
MTNRLLSNRPRCETSERCGRTYVAREREPLPNGHEIRYCRPHLSRHRDRFDEFRDRAGQSARRIGQRQRRSDRSFKWRYGRQSFRGVASAAQARAATSQEETILRQSLEELLSKEASEIHGSEEAAFRGAEERVAGQGHSSGSDRMMRQRNASDDTVAAASRATVLRRRPAPRAISHRWCAVRVRLAARGDAPASRAAHG